MRTSRPWRQVDRRKFLGDTALATVAVLAPSRVFGTRANSELRIGMIGCGGRGTWIAELFQRDGRFRCVACADYFQDRVDAFGERFGIEPSRRFTTLSCHLRMLDDNAIDAVVIESPPFFHPEQTAAAIDADRHVFLSKPIAVDVPGCLSVADSGRKATSKKLVLLVDFQTRADGTYREVLSRVRKGAIGRLVSAEARYPWSGNVADVPTPNPEDRLRSWYGTRALSGDVIVEQDIHAVDVACWFAETDPIEAYGWCGKAIRQHGDIHDHFSITYSFPGDFLVTFTSQKAVPGALDEIRCTVYGTEGVADTDYVGEVAIRGRNPFEGGRMTDLYGRGARRNIEQFYEFITTGRHDNVTVGDSVRSNLACVLGRTAAYRRSLVSWSSMLEESEPFEFDRSGLKS